MEILIRRTATRPQLKIIMADAYEISEDDGCFVVSVQSYQHALDTAVRFINTGNIAPSGYDCAYSKDWPSLLRTQA